MPVRRRGPSLVCAIAVHVVTWPPLLLVGVPGVAQTVTRLEGEARLFASDNPFVLPGGNNEAVAAEVIVRPEIRWTLAPATTAQVSGFAAYRHYSRRYGDFLTGRVEASAAHRENEFLSFDGALSVARELPADALAESIDFSIDPRSIRERTAARGSFDWSPSARTTITGTVGGEMLRYPGSTWLTSANAYNLDIAASRRISPTTAIGIRGRTTHTDIIDVTGLDAHAVYATVAHRIGPQMEGDANIGVEWSGYDQPGNNRARLSGNGRVCYRPDRLDLCVTTSRQSEVSGFGGLQREWHVGVTANHRVSSRGRIGLAGDYRRGELGLIDSRSSALRIGGTYRHRLSERRSLVAGLDYLSRQFMVGGRNDTIVAQIGIIFGRGD